MSIGAIFAIIIVVAVVLGGALGLLRSALGGSVMLPGAVAGGAAGALAAWLLRRRARALRRNVTC